MTLWRRVVVWLRICREAWSMLAGISGKDPKERGFAVAVVIDSGVAPSVVNPQYILRPDAAVVNIARRVCEATKPANRYRTYEPDGTYETIILAYGQRAPLRVTT